LKSPIASAQERIAPDVRRRVEARLERSAVLVEEDVDALVEPHQRDRNGIVADRKHDRIVALDQRELVDRQRNRMGLCNLAHLEDRADLHLAMLRDVERFDGLVEKRKVLGRGGGRHQR
jgi:hypothetical protein